VVFEQQARVCHEELDDRKAAWAAAMRVRAGSGTHVGDVVWRRGVAQQSVFVRWAELRHGLGERRGGPLAQVQERQ
jgi:hypothetical protein